MAREENKLTLHFDKIKPPNAACYYCCKICKSDHSRSSAYKHLNTSPCGSAWPLQPSGSEDPLQSRSGEPVAPSGGLVTASLFDAAPDEQTDPDLEVITPRVLRPTTGADIPPTGYIVLVIRPLVPDLIQ